MKYPEGEAETVVGSITGQEPQSDGQLEAWLQCWSPLGILLRQPRGQPLQHFMKHSWVHAQIVYEVTMMLSFQLCHQVVVMAKLQSSSSPGSNPVPSPSSPSSPLMQEYKQGSCILLLLLHHQSHQLQLNVGNLKHSHLQICLGLAWPFSWIQITDTSGTSGTSGTPEDVSSSTAGNTLKCPRRSAYIYTPDQNSLYEVCNPSGIAVRLPPHGL